MKKILGEIWTTMKKHEESSLILILSGIPFILVDQLEIWELNPTEKLIFLWPSLLIPAIGIIQYFNRKNKNKVDELIRHNKSKMDELIEKIEEQIGDKFKNATIIYKTNIAAFNQAHIDLLRNITNQLAANTKPPKILAVDYLAPLEWWNESMTVYMAILSNYRYNVHHKSEDTDNNFITRIFVYDDLDLCNPLSVKTLFIHLEYGFRTIVFSYSAYNKLFKCFKSKLSDGERNYFKPKDLLIWDEETIEVEIESEGTYKKVRGYQSYWSIDKGRISMTKIKDDLDLKRRDNIEKIEVEDMYGDEHERSILFEMIDDEITNPESLHSIHLEFINWLLIEENLLLVKNTKTLKDCGMNTGIEFGLEEPNNEILANLLKIYKEKHYN